MNFSSFICFILICGFLGYCFMDDVNKPQQTTPQWSVDFPTFYAWFAHEVLLPLLQKMARGVDADLVYPNTVYDIMPTTVVNVPRNANAVTLVYEIEILPNMHLTLAQLEKVLTRKLRRALSQRLQLPVNSQDMQSVKVQLIPNMSGTYTMVVDMNSAISRAICNAIQAFYAQQQYKAVQQAQVIQQTSNGGQPPTP